MSGFVYSEKPIEIVSGDGLSLYDDNGTEYLDFGASYACTPAGHCHPAITEAVIEQVEQLTYVQASYPVAQRSALYDRLGEVAPGDIGNVWLCNSGTEANEAALKFARSATDRVKIVSTMQAFHGRTMGALSTTWKKAYRDPYEPLLEDVEFVPYGDEEAMAEAVDEETAAVILEPIQGEGGINPAPDGYLETVRSVTDTAGAAMIVDEIQTGVGRTGSLWAIEQTEVVPDILTCAKGIANGMPMGATLCRDWIANGAASHGSTFSGGPPVAAAANATLDVLEEADLPGQAEAMGEYVLEEVAKADIDVREIRGNGLMIGIEVKRGANRLLRDLAIEEQILALPAGRSVLRLLPPLTVETEHIDTFVAALERQLG